ncbi:aldehyde ferredoxin oxidoreductase family protein, partial [Aminobacterium sp. UBA5514]
MGSRMGTILRIDLSSHKISKEPVDEKLLRAYIGGRGYGSRILFNENPPNIDPLSPENRLLFVTGPLTGRGVPAAGRYMVVTKSPLTGYIASSNSGGYWGAELAKAGWFMIIVEGKANHPVYIHIYDQNVEIRDSSHLWGLNTHETTDRILEEIKDTKARVLCIGPAGEILSPLASIMNEKNRAAGRSGVGAVMGSKNLKAIVVRGTSRPYVAQSEELSAVLKERLEKLKKHPVTSQGLPAYGTAILVNIINQTGAYPHRNWQGSYMEDADKQSGETLAEKYLTGNYHCFGCPIGCGRITKVKEKAGEGPEYETIFAFGTCCGIASIEPIIQASYICNEYGLDTI